MLSSGTGLFSSFYHAGSLVFGGGHVVLPMLQETVGDAVSSDRFLLGYAAAQAIPGPMFTFATFLGAEMMPGAPWFGAILGTLGIFLPGLLLVVGLQNVWERWSQRPQVSGGALGLNASVVGLLLAALYQPVFSSGVTGGADLAVVIVGFYALHSLKWPIVALVAGFATAGALLLG